MKTIIKIMKSNCKIKIHWKIRIDRENYIKLLFYHMDDIIIKIVCTYFIMNYRIVGICIGVHLAG